MRQGSRRWGYAGFAAAALILTPGAGVRSQDGPAEPTGLRFELDLGSELRLASNADLDPDESEVAAISETGLQLAVASDTRNERFRLAVATDLSFATDSDVVNDPLTPPSVSLLYSREASRSRLDLRFDRRVSEVDRTVPFLLDLDGDGLAESVLLEDLSGQVAFTSASLVLQTGIDRPIGHTLALSARDRQFSDEPVESDFFDSRTLAATSTTTLRFSPVTTGTVVALVSRYTADDEEETERETQTLRVGLATALDETTAFDASVGFSQVETSTIDGETVTDGIVASIGATRELPLGSIGLTFGITLDEDGPRETLRLVRSFTFPTATLRASVGVTRQDEATNLIAEAAYVRELRTGQLTATLARGITDSVTTDDDELLTRLALNYRRQVTETSSISLGFDLLQQDQDDDTLTQAGLSAAYSTALTRDWDFSVGYRARYRDDESGEAVSNIVFARVDRSFLWRP